MIFEARYRVLFSTLLHGEKEIEDDLVQKESPFAGTKRFGMCYVDGEGRLASIGTVLEIVDFAVIPSDGRLFISNKGRERFQIKSIVKEKPILLCEVEMLEDAEDDEAELKAMGKEVTDLLLATIKLNIKMENISSDEMLLEPAQLERLGPRELSFFIASFFKDVRVLQQNLLEEDSTLKRLQREKEILGETVKYYSAAAALKSAFASSSTEGETSDTASSSAATTDMDAAGSTADSASTASASASDVSEGKDAAAEGQAETAPAGEEGAGAKAEQPDAAATQESKRLTEKEQS